jgi:hypothetical protein
VVVHDSDKFSANWKSCCVLERVGRATFVICLLDLVSH